MSDCVLANVKLETGFVYDGEFVVGTKTDIFDVNIENGKVTAIEKAGVLVQKATKGTKVIDVKENICVPAFREMHCHPDKTFLGSGWKAPGGGSIEILIENELEYMRITDKDTMKKRAESMVDIIGKNGSVFIRAHADVQSDIGLKNMYAVKEVLECSPHLSGYDLVAFPQRGLLSKENSKLINEAVKNGANIVGGIDPHDIEGNRDKALYKIIDIATSNGVGVDIHCHENGSEGIKTLNKLAELTIDAGLQGKVAVSHGFALGSATEKEVEGTAELLAEAGIEIITAVLIADPVPNVPLLLDKGVNVRLGSDNIFDSWSPFGSGKITDILTRLCLKYEMFDEYSLSRSLKLITGGITPLDDRGKRVWPNAGDDADFVFSDATCSAEMIARDKEKTMVITGGKCKDAEA